MLTICACAIVGCEPEPAPAPAATWETLPDVSFLSHPWGRYLESRHIGLDPGHGGNDGDRELESDANLAVALELKRFLERDGAIVSLTRTEDVEVPLADRPRMLEDQGAEIFISLHHNAIDNPETNYTSTWYHDDVGHEPASLDIARAVQRRIVEALRTPHKVPTPILSDKLIHPKSGFRVLRTARVPAILCEASFYTNTEEAQRLTDDRYLRREAYGYYLGIVDYFTGGTPKARRLAKSPKGTVRFHLDDGLADRGGWGADRMRIIPATISVRMDDRPLPFTYDRKQSSLTIPLKPSAGPRTIELHFQNLYKHSNYPTRLRIPGSD